MTALFKNISPGSALVPGDTVRVGFVQEHSYVALDASFATDFNGIWSKLFSVGVATPFSKNAVAKGQTTAVVDFRVTRPGGTASSLVNAIDVVTGFYIAVSSIEKLNASQGAVANQEEGAKQREVARQTEIDEQESESIINKVAKGAGQAVSVMKWVSVAIVVVCFAVALIYAGSLKNTLIPRAH